MQKLFKKYLDNEAFPCIVTDGQGAAELLKERFDLIFFTGGFSRKKHVTFFRELKFWVEVGKPLNSKTLKILNLKK